ncbi:YciI family protein [Brachybacterium sp. NPDC056505]|uniref:YciI family protein n=1 Tax=Brachybacterium sp. NPDC056505 TaxID=3345843 RepID=UPI00366DA7D9
MITFAVTYHYANDPTRLDEHRPSHREFLGGLQERGTIIASGPYTDTEGARALLLVEAADVAAVESALEDDPFRREGLIAEREIHTWNVVIGSLGSLGS